ncbi:MAG: polysaccharide biosynthesis protein [Candidatus Ryanbacteria bacterium RIFCSPHIGHO2_02_FULL_45_43]|uniref:Polysaccharide biosynthesis protein n=1 Tax=Candidatus Ryanbacteria bacterium RIFCSPHIGHO2_01_45_13 TaxID=1802112 RepID=A0A1G2FY63_9BACT|nr:MAG: polysaccharide biosynthesis protein [Candidatus Ryanbacteria bacterium RIFCSPHIGHO2_01_FULL_44_130]OGZ42757.1 MAG: polysaccharide biosynthesis protein [Candidatus Ryanbacteria bacterium RIFCSPHIGHO2_01_45_13]OGZ48856.1 MAG: polysaccharide biosynthesis protein [Candidatus Ryanbacteria bacterium RIFCSPHIGHO2_02_FULL_45_43]OGZ50888.1 MAG: polysaccharide biosynthesis protein [Candidatus Ryanbacteria bacterium RIFCSPHIGHO2_12_FULL_44_20]OGZ52119.1 MAG: polysaccharide biosynthesis protein [Ca
MIIPPSWPDVTAKEIKAVIKILRTSYLGRGPVVYEFEKMLARYIGVRHAVATSSGTSALHLAVEVLGIGRGDLVITTPFSFIASSNCMLFVGARPVFVDIDSKTLNININEVEKQVKKLQSRPATRRKLKAILAVDIFGYPADWKALRRIARTYGLYLIEDAGEALGAELQYEGKWRKAGSFGNVAILAFTHNKQITTGEGGVLLTNNKRLAELAWSKKNHGREIGGGWLDHVRLGYNYHLSDMNCALGIAQLKRIKQILEKRKRVAALYTKSMRDIKDIELPYVDVGVKRSWFVYVVRLAGFYTKRDRDRLIKRLLNRGIHCRNYFPSIHLQKFYRDTFGYKKGDFPVTEDVSERTIALPFYGNMHKHQIDYVARNFIDVLKKS